MTSGQSATVFGQLAGSLMPRCSPGTPMPAPPSRLPVFVIGFPRSGTTMVEQILASHPQVYGAGELIDISELAGKLSKPGRPFRNH